MRTVSYAAILFAALKVSALAQPTNTERALERAIVPNIEGSARDFWIATVNAMGELERVGLIFGLGDNLAFCQDAVDGYRDRFPNSRFICIPAN